jgi:predicted CXXCH cytochrome family protein
MGMVALSVLIFGTAAWARVGGPCVNCHTMHNSQDGLSVVDTTIGMQPALTTTDCVGCHSSASETIVDLGDGTRIPIVYTTSAPNLTPGTSTSMLAGGNFHWVAQGDDTKGHNVYRISAADSLLNNAPGASASCSPCHDTLATANSGCRGCHFPAHHADDSAAVVDGEHGAYRFLGNVMSKAFVGWPPEYSGDWGLGSAGVKGIEDSDWEQTVSSTDHNTYSGTEIVYPKVSFSYLNNSVIGEVCTGCHGNFHHKMNTGQGDSNTVAGDVSGVWIRHPTDVLIPNEGEYAAYTTYNPLAPAAKQNLDAGMKNSPTVTPGSDIVTCISCHRPHGSPYPDLLRWDYDTCDAGTANSACGCYACHTTKDD